MISIMEGLSRGCATRRVSPCLCLLYTSYSLFHMEQVGIKAERERLKEYGDPVSYTHLDVYKRQDIKGTPFISFVTKGILIHAADVMAE